LWGECGGGRTLRRAAANDHEKKGADFEQPVLKRENMGILERSKRLGEKVSLFGASSNKPGRRWTRGERIGRLGGDFKLRDEVLRGKGEG